MSISTKAKITIMTISAMKDLVKNGSSMGSWIEKEKLQLEEMGQEFKDDANWSNLRDEIRTVVYENGDKVEKTKSDLVEFVSNKPIGFLMDYKTMDSVDKFHQFIQEALTQTHDIELKPVFITFYWDIDEDECRSAVYNLEDQVVENTKTGNKRKQTKLSEKIQFVGEESNAFECFIDDNAEVGGEIHYIGYAMICTSRGATKHQKN